MKLLVKYSDTNPTLKSQFTVNLPSLGDTPYMHSVIIEDGGEVELDANALDWDYIKSIITLSGVKCYDNTTGTPVEITTSSTNPFGASTEVVRRITGVCGEVFCAAADYTGGKIGVLGDYSIVYTDGGDYFQFFDGEPHPFLAPKDGFVVGWALVDATKTITDIDSVEWNFFPKAGSAKQTVEFTGDTTKKLWYCYDARLTDPSEYLLDTATGTWAHASNSGTVSGVTCDVQIATSACADTASHKLYCQTYPHVTWNIYADTTLAGLTTAVSVTDSYGAGKDVNLATGLIADGDIYYAYEEQGVAPTTVTPNAGTAGAVTAEADQVIGGKNCKVFKMPVTSVSPSTVMKVTFA